ncbi:MAG: hypothetical protein JWN66_2543 [Sphingomonas bacterium]|uniref:hypothetical protein n=1 Tax=Sphingomonas bacterium TaxID=1895847 RepID=UPI0026327E5A|nr:hypothetical protein [Sphingomonas bacterium]MDB5705427.1 hypothetical protein [Sphingomonas bacterium]
MKRIAFAILPGLLLAGCGGAGVAPRPARAAPVPIPIPGGVAGLDRVMGQPGGALIGLFGQPLADVREGNARKLQFGNAICVLDAYLYPKGRGEPIVTYVDARQTNGSPIDRASCVGALSLGRR